LYDEGDSSLLYDIGSFPPTERIENRLGDRYALPSQYGEIPQYAHIAGQPGDIGAVDSATLDREYVGLITSSGLEVAAIRF
jgi:type I restriction enzyme M protein